MSSKHVSFVWSSPRPRGSHRLVLLAVADCANHAGVAEASARTIASMTALDKTEVCAILTDLRRIGFLHLVSKAQGSTPARYRVCAGEVASDADDRTEWQDITPKVSTDAKSGKLPATAPLVQKDIVPAEPVKGAYHVATQSDVDAVLAAAGISAPDDQPFYWNRKEHRDDLTALLARYGRPVDALCTDLRAALSKGKALQHRPRRLTELSAILGKGVAA